MIVLGSINSRQNAKVITNINTFAQPEIVVAQAMPTCPRRGNSSNEKAMFRTTETAAKIAGVRVSSRAK